MATADHPPVRIVARLGVLACTVGLALAAPTTAAAGELRLPSVLEISEQPADPSSENSQPPPAPADPEDSPPPPPPADPEDSPPPPAPADPEDSSHPPASADPEDSPPASTEPEDPSDDATIDPATASPRPATTAPQFAPPAPRSSIAPEPPPSPRQLPTPPKPRRLHLVSNGLALGFMLTGAGAIGSGAYFLTDSVATTDTGQTLKIPGFVLGSTLAIGGSAMLGGGTGMLVATAVARDPAKRRPLRHASWIFLVGAGALASASAYTALDARQQWQDVDPTAPNAYAASNAAFNKAAVLAVLAVSPDRHVRRHPPGHPRPRGPRPALQRPPAPAVRGSHPPRRRRDHRLPLLIAPVEYAPPRPRLDTLLIMVTSVEIPIESPSRSHHIIDPRVSRLRGGR